MALTIDVSRRWPLVIALMGSVVGLLVFAWRAYYAAWMTACYSDERLIALYQRRFCLEVGVLFILGAVALILIVRLVKIRRTPAPGK